MPAYQYFRLEKSTVGFMATVYIDSTHQDILDVIAAEIKQAVPECKTSERKNSTIRGYAFEKLYNKETALMRGILVYLLDSGWKPVNWSNLESGPFTLCLETETPAAPPKLTFAF